MDITDWSYLYKKDYINGHDVTTNLLYTPLVNPEGNIMCMVWDEEHKYQQQNNQLSKELVNFFFEREVKYLTIMQRYAWAPKIISIDKENRQIFIEWNKETINHVICGDRPLDEECPTWRNQIYNILQDINLAGYYKMALYPHCFFINKDGILKTIDFYSVIEKDNPFIERQLIQGIIGRDSTGRFDRATNKGIINFEEFFKITMLDHLGKTWIRENPFPMFYKRLFNN
jgi:hypothetical protein